jgi:diguanylate cyclase (GGDEF)-like protein
MSTSILEKNDFAAAVIDALSSQICVLDRNGVIIATNRAWRDFALENSAAPGNTPVGMNYLDICRGATGPGAEGAAEIAAGIQSVLDGRTESVRVEYPCHSPTQRRWFVARVTPLETDQGGAVVAHTSITDRKDLELELEKLAATDSLTALPNRRHFLTTANLEVERVRRFGVKAAVMMVDLDHFKAVNDMHGHAVGDEALRQFGRACQAKLRKIDELARIGGEEFAIVLPGADEIAAGSVAEKLRREVAKTRVKSDQTDISITASFGVSEIRASDDSVEDSLGRADQALYAAKRAGRNCVRRYSAISRDAV